MILIKSNKKGVFGILSLLVLVILLSVDVFGACQISGEFRCEDEDYKNAQWVSPNEIYIDGKTYRAQIDTWGRLKLDVGDPNSLTQWQYATVNDYVIDDMVIIDSSKGHILSDERYYESLSERPTFYLEKSDKTFRVDPDDESKVQYLNPTSNEWEEEKGVIRDPSTGDIKVSAVGAEKSETEEGTVVPWSIPPPPLPPDWEKAMTDAGFSTASSKYAFYEKWKDTEGITSVAAGEWIGYGVTEPKDAKNWIDHKVSPQEASSLTLGGFHSYDDLVSEASQGNPSAIQGLANLAKGDSDPKTSEIQPNADALKDLSNLAKTNDAAHSALAGMAEAEGSESAAAKSLAAVNEARVAAAQGGTTPEGAPAAASAPETRANSITQVGSTVGVIQTPEQSSTITTTEGTKVEVQPVMGGSDGLTPLGYIDKDGNVYDTTGKLQEGLTITGGKIVAKTTPAAPAPAPAAETPAPATTPPAVKGTGPEATVTSTPTTINSLEQAVTYAGTDASNEYLIKKFEAGSSAEQQTILKEAMEKAGDNKEAQAAVREAYLDARRKEIAEKDSKSGYKYDPKSNLAIKDGKGYDVDLEKGTVSSTPSTRNLGTTQPTSESQKDQLSLMKTLHGNDVYLGADGKFYDGNNNIVSLDGKRTAPSTIITDDKTTLKKTDYIIGYDNGDPETGNPIYVYTDSKGISYSQKSKGEISKDTNVYIDKKYGKGDEQITIRETHTVLDNGKVGKDVKGGEVRQGGEVKFEVDAFSLGDVRDLVKGGAKIEDVKKSKSGNVEAVEANIMKDGKLVGKYMENSMTIEGVKGAVVTSTVESNYIESATGQRDPGRKVTRTTDEQKDKTELLSQQVEGFTHTYSYKDDKGEWHRTSDPKVLETWKKQGVKEDDLQTNLIHSRDDSLGSQGASITYWRIGEDGKETIGMREDFDENGRISGYTYIDQSGVPYSTGGDARLDSETRETLNKGWVDPDTGMTVDEGTPGAVKEGDYIQQQLTKQKNTVIFSTVETVLTEYQGLSYYSPYLFGEDEVQKWKDEVYSWFDNAILGGSDYWVSQLCMHHYDTDAEDSAYYVTPDGQVVEVAHIEGERSSKVPKACPCDPGQRCEDGICFDRLKGDMIYEYFYKITFFVNAAHDDVGFKVELHIEGESKTVGLYDVKWVEIDRGGSYRATGGNAIVQYSPKLYDKVCLKFKGSIPIGRDENGAEEERSEFCNSIAESDAEYDDYDIVPSGIGAGGAGGGSGEQGDPRNPTVQQI